MQVYVYLNHFVVQQKLIEHCKSTILQFFFKYYLVNIDQNSQYIVIPTTKEASDF